VLPLWVLVNQAHNPIKASHLPANILPMLLLVYLQRQQEKSCHPL